MKNQFTVVQDFYKAVLEKRASEVAEALSPNYGLDSREIALKEIEKNKVDQRKDLGKYLEAVGREEKADNSTMDKALPEATSKDSTDTSNPMLKVAMNKAFFKGLRQLDFLKTASADYMKVVYSSFQDEMSRIR